MSVTRDSKALFEWRKEVVTNGVGVFNPSTASQVLPSLDLCGPNAPINEYMAPLCTAISPPEPSVGGVIFDHVCAFNVKPDMIKAPINNNCVFMMC